MTGHEVLLKLRRDRLLPSRSLYIADSDSPFDRLCAENWHQCESSATGLWEPHVLVEEFDVPEHLDLRFCIGLVVHLSALRGIDRAQRLFKAIRSAQPELLACVVGDEVWYYSKEIGGNGKRFH